MTYLEGNFNNLKGFGRKWRTGNVLFETSVALIAFLLFFFFAPFAFGHKWAASSFDAVTAGKNIRIEFWADAISCKELVEKEKQIENLEKEKLLDYKAFLKKYWKKNFSVTNNNQKCKLAEITRFSYAEKKDKMVLGILYKCTQDLDAVELKTTLFKEEETTHRLVSTFRHKRAKENYVFSPGSSALIHVNKLRQMPARTYAKPGTYAMTQHPPGGYKKLEKTAESTQKGDKATVKKSNLEELDAEPVVTTQATKVESGFFYFVKEGVIHILGGLDHVLFVICLVVAIYGRKQLITVVTSFTIAHSITLVFGALNLITVSPYLVEPIIALSIIYVAVENIIREKPNARTAVTFGFGLIHGFGFSGVLRNLGLPTNELVPALLGFNLGVEIGQLIIVIPLFFLIIKIRNNEKLYVKSKRFLCAGVTLVAAWWFVERVIDAINGA